MPASISVRPQHSAPWNKASGPKSPGKKEYHLTDAQFAQVVQLHDAYHPKCAEMCRRIDDQNAKIQQLLAATNAVTPEIKQALDGAAQLRTQCESAMLQHFYEVSRVMPPE